MPEHIFPRPVPLVGDTTSAAARAGDPTGWALPVADREALHRILAARRDVRRFRPDPVPDEVLLRALDAAHHGPSVGHSQPWRFLVVSEQRTRDAAALLADRERLRQANQLPEDRRRRLLDLQLEGVREAPLGIVVACDRRTAPERVLGRATFPDTDLWSCACAIENLWLAARAEGLGLGWVTFFRPDELAELLGLPEGVQTLGWLCLGWPDERPPGPGLERAGWSSRLALADVVVRERWHEQVAPLPAWATPGPPPSAVVAARDQGDDVLTPLGALGALDAAVQRMLAVHGLEIPEGELLLVAAQHPVAALGVSSYDSSVTDDVVVASAEGTSAGAVAATEAGLSLLLVDARPGCPVPGALHRPPREPLGDLAHTDALSSADTRTLLDTGRELAMRSPGRLLALGEVGIGNTTVAACLAARLLGAAVEDVIGLGAGSDSALLARKLEVVTAALARTQGIQDPLDLLAALGGADVAMLTGAVLAAPVAGRLVVLDGLLTSVAALIATRVDPSIARYLVAGQRSRERAHGLVLTELGLEPLLDLRLRAGEGVGACLATSLLLHASRLRRLTARTRERP